MKKYGYKYHHKMKRKWMNSPHNPFKPIDDISKFIIRVNNMKIGKSRIKTIFAIGNMKFR